MYLFEMNIMSVYNSVVWRSCNVLNSLAVISLCHYEGVPSDIIQKGLESFEGVKRRFTETVIGERVIIDDYAHHPTEIKATIQSARQKYPDREIIAVFQPHTFTRTKKFLNEFAESFESFRSSLFMRYIRFCKRKC